MMSHTIFQRRRELLKEGRLRCCTIVSGDVIKVETLLTLRPLRGRELNDAGFLSVDLQGHCLRFRLFSLSGHRKQDEQVGLTPNDHKVILSRRQIGGILVDCCRT